MNQKQEAIKAAIAYFQAIADNATMPTYAKHLNVLLDTAREAVTNKCESCRNMKEREIWACARCKHRAADLYKEI